MAPDVTTRYQRASDVLEDLLAARAPAAARRPAAVSKDQSRARDDAQGIQSRLRAREVPAGRFCWQCRKPLHARTDRCPFCGETQ
jgi:hypothetical protein